MSRLASIWVVCAALAGSASFAQSGTSDAVEVNDAETTAYAEAFDKSFRTAFRIKSVNQCVASASASVAAKLDITPSCACITDTLLATKSVKELQVLNTADPNNEELKAVVASCLKSDPPWPVGQQHSNEGQSHK